MFGILRVEKSVGVEYALLFTKRASLPTRLSQSLKRNVGHLQICTLSRRSLQLQYAVSVERVAELPDVAKSVSMVAIIL
jgi:hypothetical protein